MQETMQKNHVFLKQKTDVTKNYLSYLSQKYLGKSNFSKVIRVSKIQLIGNSVIKKLKKKD